MPGLSIAPLVSETDSYGSLKVAKRFRVAVSADFLAEHVPVPAQLHTAPQPHTTDRERDDIGVCLFDLGTSTVMVFLAYVTVLSLGRARQGPYP